MKKPDDESTALSIIEALTASPQKDLLSFFIKNVCPVGCGIDEGCWYCKNCRDAIKRFIAESNPQA